MLETFSPTNRLSIFSWYDDDQTLDKLAGMITVLLIHGRVPFNNKKRTKRILVAHDRCRENNIFIDCLSYANTPHIYNMWGYKDILQK